MARVPRSAAEALPAGKNVAAMAAAEKPYSVKSNHSTKLPMKAASSVRAPERLPSARPRIAASSVIVALHRNRQRRSTNIHLRLQHDQRG
jgi:hypothetical protein